MQVIANNVSLLPRSCRTSAHENGTRGSRSPLFPHADRPRGSSLDEGRDRVHSTERSGASLGFVGLGASRTQHHEIVRIADDFTRATFGPGSVEGVQVDVGEERGDNPTLGRARDRLGHDTPSANTPARNHWRSNLSTRRSETRSPTSERSLLVVDLAEEVLDVGLKDKLLAL